MPCSALNFNIFHGFQSISWQCRSGVVTIPAGLVESIANRVDGWQVHHHIHHRQQSIIIITIMNIFFIIIIIIFVVLVSIMKWRQSVIIQGRILLVATEVGALQRECLPCNPVPEKLTKNFLQRALFVCKTFGKRINL